MQIIPAIDLYNGKCVRLHKGDYDAVTVYNESPIEQAQIFHDAGFDHIHIVDLNGAKKGVSLIFRISLKSSTSWEFRYKPGWNPNV